MKILLDMDEVLVDFMGPSLYYYNEEYGTDFQLEEIGTWALPGDQKKWEKIWRIPGFFSSLPPIDGAIEGVKGLVDRGHDVLVASSPVVWEACKGKYQWFHMHLRVPGILHMEDLMLGRDKGWLKGDLIVDDGLHNLQCSEVLGVAFDRPWNEAWGGLRAHNWEDVLRIVDNLSSLNNSYHLGGCY